MTEPTRYPLAWPPGKPRARSRRNGSFKSYNRPITALTAIGRLEAELDRLGARYPLLSSNFRTRLDGTPILNQGAPLDPGVCVYFQLKALPYALACDTYTEVQQNIAALAAHIAATRSIERYGVATAAETLRAFQALPPPAVVQRPWHEVFGINPAVADKETIEALFKVKARKAHPDQGGTAAAMAELNAARDEALRALV